MSKQGVSGLGSALVLILTSTAFTANAGVNSLNSALGKATEGIAATQAVLAPAVETESTTTDLVGMAMSQLNLTKPQAQGGLGALFALTQTNLSENEFSQLSSGVPGMDSLLSAIPALSGGGSAGGLGGMVSSLAGSSMVTQQLAALGISPELVGPLVQIVMDYLGKNGGDDGLSALFSKGIGGLLGE
jgi:hypothetical protein